MTLRKMSWFLLVLERSSKVKIKALFVSQSECSIKNRVRVSEIRACLAIEDSKFYLESDPNIHSMNESNPDLVCSLTY